MIGRVLGHYRVVEKIGAGGMGDVYRAHDERLDRDVALKVLPAGLLADETARRRFRKEALALSRLSHPQIATVHDFDSQEGVDFLVMELIPGLSLSQRPGRALPEKEVLGLGAQLLEGLMVAHKAGVVHRDLKPGNLHVTPDGRLKILDFGLAALAKPGTEEPTSNGSLSEMVVAGTPPYMAPEQLRGESVDARTDVYAAGAVLYELATGRRPFPETGPRLIDAILHQPPSSPTTPGKGVSPGLQFVILKALEKEPRHRYQTAHEMRVDLERLLAPGSAASPAPSPRRGRRWAWALAGTVVLAALAGAWILHGRGPRMEPITSLAVLPLANLSGDPSQEYFADGMTEELITELAQVDALKIISRTSAMHYKGTTKSVGEIARELDVDALVEGSVQRAGGRVRITAQLIRASSDKHIWAQSYERDLKDVLALQNEVARAITGEIRIRLTPQEEIRLGRARPVNPEAYEAYLKGLHHWYKMIPADLETSQRYLELALAKDPDYAPAQAGLALLWGARAQMGLSSPAEAAPRVREAAMKAVALDDTLARAHLAMAQLRGWHEWDLAGAEPEFKRAIELNPNSPDARAFYSNYLNIMGRPAEASPQIARALEADPFNVLFQSIYATHLFYGRRYDEAIEQSRRALRITADAPIAHNVMWGAFERKRMYGEAAAEVKYLLASVNGVRDADEALDRALARGGYPVAMRRAAEALAARAREAWVNPTDIAALYVSAGDPEQAFAWLEKGPEARDPNMLYLGWPNWDPIRADPRFQDLLRRMRLPH